MAYFERFLSRRYLFSHERKALLTAITGIAISGVAVGVAALVIVIGVMDGAEEELFGKMLAIFPHVKVVASKGDEIAHPEEVLAAARKFPEITIAEPVVAKQGLFKLQKLQSSPQAQLVAGLVMGVSDINNNHLYPVRNSTPGEALTLGRGEVVIGAPLAKKLGVKTGDAVIYITGLLPQSANRVRAGVPLLVSGVFETGYYAFDSVTAFVSSQTALDSFSAGDAADYIDIKLADPFKAADVGRRLRAELPPSYVVQTWEQEQGFFFQSLALQKAALFLILMLIVLVAGFNIIGTLILLVIDKTREIGILKAIGSSNGAIRKAFVNSGMLIGLLGTSLGVTLGLIVCYLLKYVIRLDMPPSVYNFEHLPVLVKPVTVGLIVLSAMVVCLIASYFPAVQASRLDPVEALRHE